MQFNRRTLIITILAAFIAIFSLDICAIRPLKPAPKPQKREKVRRPKPKAKPEVPKGLHWKADSNLIALDNNRYRMVFVAGGRFTMGASESDVDAYPDEKPAHDVVLDGYYIGETEVPQWLWKAVMENNPSKWMGDSLPVEQVGWEDCQMFLKKLNEITKCEFNLPSEAQWEFAARGGNYSCGHKYSGGTTLDELGWYKYNSKEKTHEIKTKTPNELGLYDMTGNVWEWCTDWFSDSYYKRSASHNPDGPAGGTNRVVRGGSWGDSANDSRVTVRGYGVSVNGLDNIGLRIVLKK